MVYRFGPEGNEMRQISDKGSDSPIVARTFLQPSHLMKAFGLPRGGHDDVVEILMRVQRRLLRAEEIRCELEDARLTAESETDTRDGLVRTPHVIDLPLHADSHLQQIKLAVTDALSLTAPLYGKLCGLPVNAAIKWARRLGPDSPLLQRLVANQDWIERVQKLRNCVEHPRQELRLELVNLGEDPDLQGDRLYWYATGEDPSDMLQEMECMSEATLCLSEEMLADYLMKERRHKFLTIVEVPIEQRDPSAPVRLRADLELDLSG